MNVMTQYRGGLLNHLEALYRPGDRELAIEFVEALGCTTTDTGFATETGATYISVCPHGAESDPLNNDCYSGKMERMQVLLEDIMPTEIDAEGGM